MGIKTPNHILINTKLVLVFILYFSYADDSRSPKERRREVRDRDRDRERDRDNRGNHDRINSVVSKCHYSLEVLPSCSLWELYSNKIYCKATQFFLWRIGNSLLIFLRRISFLSLRATGGQFQIYTTFFAHILLFPNRNTIFISFNFCDWSSS